MSYVEYLYHFTCERCKLWWSIALDKEGWKAKKMWCPHCGNKKEYTTEIDYEMMKQ